MHTPLSVEWGSNQEIFIFHYKFILFNNWKLVWYTSNIQQVELFYRQYIACCIDN